jgi:hypothetical protein
MNSSQACSPESHELCVIWLMLCFCLLSSPPFLCLFPLGLNKQREAEGGGACVAARSCRVSLLCVCGCFHTCPAMVTPPMEQGQWLIPSCHFSRNWNSRSWSSSSWCGRIWCRRSWDKLEHQSLEQTNWTRISWNSRSCVN